MNQCLQSVFNSKTELNYEVIVIDNNSVDGSSHLIPNAFPQITYIYNEENKGFGKANNQAFKIAKGEYVLLLNPDTLIEEDTLDVCYDRMVNDQTIGALGVKLLDGSGEFLVESKRSFPTIWSSFSKLSGLASIFKGSARFDSYNLGNLDANKEHEVDVLCGAMMLVKRDLLSSLNGFDEAFFMYGEDIDLCRRIKDTGHKILYYPETQIIHFKGESSGRKEFAYYKMFYEAMITYVKKHYQGSSALYAVLLKLAIWVRGCTAYLFRILKSAIPLLLDFISILGILWVTCNLWAKHFFSNPNYYDKVNIWNNIFAYAGIWIFTMWLMGNYDRRTGLKNFLLGFFLGIVLNLTLYALLPLELRFSRAILLIGSIVILVIILLNKFMVNKWSTGKFSSERPLKKKLLLVGSVNGVNEIEELLHSSQIKFERVGVFAPENLESSNTGYLSFSNHLAKLAEVTKANEIIFSSKSVPYKAISKSMSMLPNYVSMKIAGRNFSNIIGSDSNKEAGELYTIDIDYRIKRPVMVRMKRSLDLFFSFFALLISPIRWIIIGLDLKAFSEPFRVLLNQRTWIGYDQEIFELNALPHLKGGIFSASGHLGKQYYSINEMRRINEFYARNYNVVLDIEIFFKSIFNKKP